MKVLLPFLLFLAWNATGQTVSVTPLSGRPAERFLGKPAAPERLRHITDLLLHDLYFRKPAGSGLLHFTVDQVEWGICNHCGFQCPSELRGDSIVLFWSPVWEKGCSPAQYKAVEQRKTPGRNQPFAVFTLINDSTLGVQYLHPEWVKAYNGSHKDFFPTRFLLCPLK